MLIQQFQNNLKQTIALLQQMDNAFFTQKHSTLSNATIGEHIRHTIELLGCLLDNYDGGIVNYDKRERNQKMQTDVDFAISILDKYCADIVKENKTMQLVYNCGIEKLQLPTNYFRELIYNLEHSIHHQALIKVVVQNLPNIQLDAHFGVAPSTIEYRKQCAL